MGIPVIAKITPKDDGRHICRLFSIRKFTESECLRLMDVPEELIQKMVAEKGLTKSFLYKLAGNSIVCSCLKHIFEQMYFPKYQNFNIGMPDKINLVTLCSGYDSQAIALEQMCKEQMVESDLIF